MKCVRNMSKKGFEYRAKTIEIVGINCSSKL
jgi:hypothetical protein